MEIIIYLLSVIVMILSAILGYIINKIGKVEKEMADHRQDVNNAVMTLTQKVNDAVLKSSNETTEVRIDYLDRFRDLKAHGDKNTEDLKTLIGTMSEALALIKRDLSNHIGLDK